MNFTNAWNIHPKVAFKLLKRRFMLVDSFCRKCGRDVHDFVVPNHIWEQVDPHIGHGHTLCYDCFCETCAHIGLPSVWCLEVAA
jgi:hypothetical protein